MIQGDQHAGTGHPLNIGIRRNDHIVARIAFLQLGEKLVIVSKKIQLGLDASGLFEVLKSRFANIRCPSCRN